MRVGLSVCDVDVSSGSVCEGLCNGYGWLVIVWRMSFVVMVSGMRLIGSVKSIGISMSWVGIVELLLILNLICEMSV